MGEVYRGTDTRLDRVVALKILPSHLSSNPELRERFDREARAISSLSDPHICTLYDVGHHDGTDYLVMEFVEGESLEERLKKGPLPMEQVFRYAIEIAEALDKAHRHAIVHRDLKPSNIMISKSGVKLLDFGLAKMATHQEAVLQLSHLPTAQRQLTQEGTILGTFQYMAPEQLEGLEADARTDIFAFGVVLYEMATGRRAFEGKTKTSLIAAIVDRDPQPMASIQPMTPPAFERVVKTCLAKDPDDRWQSARDIANELRWIEQSAPQLPVLRKRWQWIAWAVAALAVVTAVTLATLWNRARTRRASPLTFSIVAPERINIDFDNGPMVLSSDGSRLAFLGVDLSGKRLIWIRPLHSLSAQPLAGTEDATDPFWSPDGRFIGFFAGGKLKKIDATGGPAQSICDANQPRGGTWGADGTIVFARESQDGLYKVSSSGGNVAHLTSLQKGEASHRWPFFLPDGKHLIFLVGRGYGYGYSNAVSNSIDLLTLATNTRKRLVDTQSSAQYAAGQLLFVHDQALVAQVFDARNLNVSGEPVPIAEGIAVTSTGGTVFSANDRGHLVYQTGAGLGLSSLQWFDRSGKLLGDVASNADYRFPAISHDGRRVAVEIMTPTGNGDIWIIDLVRSTQTKLTFDPASEFYPIWSPDDRYIYFTSNRNDPGDIYRKIATGVGPDEEVVRMPGFTLMTDISSDGRCIAFQSLDPRESRGWDIWIYSTAEKRSFPFLATRFTEAGAKFSPDGRWIAYRSDESGRTEVYVQSFPPSGGKWQISTNGGNLARWSSKGDEIFYPATDGKLMVVPIKTSGGTFEAGIPKPLFDLHTKSTPDTRFDITPDGERILVNTAIRDEVKSPMTFMENWPELLGKP